MLILSCVSVSVFVLGFLCYFIGKFVATSFLNITNSIKEINTSFDKRKRLSGDILINVIFSKQ